MSSGPLRPKGWTVRIMVLALVPVLIVLFGAQAWLRTDAVYSYAGVSYDERPKLVDAEPSIDPNFGMTSQALGMRAALDVWRGRLPLWNPYQGLGAPLLGEMQSAALFPPTWLMVLPHGQVIEQALLQLLAGLGTYLFLRSQGLRIRTALVGGLAFEVNGIFAWLRNAIFNPVAFLPWLFFAVERLHAGAVSGRPLRRRLPGIALAAVFAALALYSGFPEEAYLYGLLLAVWAVLRATNLSLAQLRSFVVDLALAGGLALLLGAPLLASFADYLGAAELGGHANGGFGGISLRPSGIIQYLTPYIYGPIFGSKNPVVSDIWGSTGGYIGFTPIVLALASLATPGRRAMKAVLAGWVVLSLAVTHGVPGIFQAFMMIPLTKSAAVFRYLNASWIFCLIVLSALFIDAIPDLTPRARSRILAAALVGAVLAVLAAVGAAWPLMSGLVAASGFSAVHFAAMALAVAVLAALLAAAARSRTQRAGLLVSATLLLEAWVWFAYPYLAYPRAGRLDADLIAFLRANAGFQRVMGSEDASIGPNYGSYFGIATLIYDDLPSPQMTTAYVKDNLDPYAGTIAFGPWPPGLTPEQRADRRATFRTRLPAYARAGVKFVLAGGDFDLASVYAVKAGEGVDKTLRPLGSGQTVEVAGRASSGLTSSAVSVLLRPGPGPGSSRVTATLCADMACVSGQVDVEAPGDERRLSVFLDHPVALAAGGAYTIRIARDDGDADLDLGFLPRPDGPSTVSVTGSGTGDRPDLVPDIRLVDDRVTLAYTGQSMSVYALADVRPYASAPGCAVEARSRERIVASCPAPSRLTRLELAMRGWSARVDGAPAEIGTAEGAFQTVDLPAGRTQIVFRFAPRFFTPALAAAVLAALVLLGIAVDRMAMRGAR